jgi:hypothetical protein
MIGNLIFSACLDYGVRLPIYQFSPEFPHGEVGFSTLRDLRKQLSEQETEAGSMKLVPANYYVWSNDVARAFADSIYNFMDPEVAVERGLRLYWTPALDGLYKLLEECPDLSSLTSDKNQPEVAPANRSVESPGDQLPASNGETLVSPEVTPKPAEAPNRFFLQAEYWSITFEGKTKNFKNTLGFRYIEFLIRNQGEKIHVRDLLHAINPPDRETVDPTL